MIAGVPPTHAARSPPDRRPDAVHVVGAAILDGDRCLVAQRGPTMSSPSAWEFPGGKVEPGESPRQALRRELREELGVEAEILDRLGTASAPAGRRTIVLEVFFARLVSGNPEPREHQALRWIGAPEVGDLDWCAPDRPLLPALERRLRGLGTE